MSRLGFMPEKVSEKFTDIQHIVNETNNTVDQHYSSVIKMVEYRHLVIQLTGSTGGSGVVFTIFGTLNPSAAVPADGDAAPSGDWVDLSTDILGAGTVTHDVGTSGMYFVDTPSMAERFIIRYDCDNATNSTDIFIRKFN